VRFRVDQFPAGTGEALPDLVDGHAGVHGRDPTPTEAEHQKRRARRGGMGGASDVRGSPVVAVNQPWRNASDGDVAPSEQPGP
jgi:hypothetical protein